jgi:quercetin dioxygenase-like cupin family protein
MQAIEAKVVGTVNQVMGTLCRTIVHGGESDGQLTIVHVEIPQAGIGVPTHVHDREDETFHVLEGKIKITVDGRENIIGPGETSFGPRAVPHAWVALTPAKLVVSATPAGLDDTFEEICRSGATDPADILPICRRYGVEFL